MKSGNEKVDQATLSPFAPSTLGKKTQTKTPEAVSLSFESIQKGSEPFGPYEFLGAFQRRD